MQLFSPLAGALLLAACSGAAGRSRFERTFDEAGSFAYICTIHPSMMATIAVSG
jgi:plastocyanin